MVAKSACGRLENARKIVRADGFVHHDALAAPPTGTRIAG